MRRPAPHADYSIRREGLVIPHSLSPPLASAWPGETIKDPCLPWRILAQRIIVHDSCNGGALCVNASGGGRSWPCQGLAPPPARHNLLYVRNRGPSPTSFGLVAIVCRPEWGLVALLTGIQMESFDQLCSRLARVDRCRVGLLPEGAGSAPPQVDATTRVCLGWAFTGSARASAHQFILTISGCTALQNHGNISRCPACISVSLRRRASSFGA